MTSTFSYSIDEMFAEIEKFTRLQMEYKERTLAEIITKYDFIVGSKECKYRLMKVLSERANIICSPYIESPTTIYVIKKFDTMDYMVDPQEVLSKMRAELESSTEKWWYGVENDCFMKLSDVLQIIDKYKAESEDENESS